MSATGKARMTDQILHTNLEKQLLDHKPSPAMIAGEQESTLMKGFTPVLYQVGRMKINLYNQKVVGDQ